MIIELLIGQLFLALFNIANSYIDAYRILSNKTIAHAVNFSAYLIACAIICFLLGIHLLTPVLLFFGAAFLNRQFSFDIPLNIRRGLAWYYQSQADPPAALLDRIERAIFGTGEYVGKRILKAYTACYAVTVILWLWIV